MAAPMKHSLTLLSQLYSREYILFSRSFLQGRILCCRKETTESTTSTRIESKIVITKPKPIKKSQKISRAMRAYLEKAQKYEKELADHTAEYELGRRHLANIMGEDPDNFTHTDIKRAVRYLLPSGLHQKRARPVVQLPEDVLPVHRVAQFGSDGRPYHFMFYTNKPLYYEILYEVTQRLEKLKAKEDAMYKGGKSEEIGAKKLNLVDSMWVDYDNFQKLLKEETITENDYNDFVKNISRLGDHPLNYIEEEFLMKYRQRKLQLGSLKAKALKNTGEGRKFTTANGKRKSAKADVKLIVPGTGEFLINGQSILYFHSIMHREQVMYPLDLTGKLGEADVEAKVEGGGSTGQSGAIRLALSRALVDFVDQEMVEKMRQAGLLTSDPRVRERKKISKKGARKGYTWKRR